MLSIHTCLDGEVKVNESFEAFIEKLDLRLIDLDILESTQVALVEQNGVYYQMNLCNQKLITTIV